MKQRLRYHTKNKSKNLRTTVAACFAGDEKNGATGYYLGHAVYILKRAQTFPALNETCTFHT